MEPYRAVRWCLLILALSGCASRDWREVVAANASSTYSTYAATHPGTARALVAARRAQERGWEEAVASNQSVAYFSYAAAWPSGEHAAEAQTRAEMLGWSEASADGSISALTSYIARYSSSEHVGEARARVEDLVYAEIEKQPDEPTFRRYIVQYPEGRYTTEVRARLEQFIWDKTVAEDTRQAYRQYLERYPAGAHANNAQAWLAETRVTLIQPLIAVISPGQTDLATVISQMQRTLDRGLAADLTRNFTVRPTKTLDATRGLPHPHDLLTVEPGVGILVIEYQERRGRTFDPSGNATDISTIVRLYAPNTRTPVYIWEISATTPDKVHGTDMSALHAAAVEDLGEQLRSLDEELASLQREKM